MISVASRRHPTRLFVLGLLHVAGVLLLGGAVSCGDPLGVDDPTAILESDVSDASGAELLRRGAIDQLRFAAQGLPFLSGVLADEFIFQSPLGSTNDRELLDRRNTVDYQQVLLQHAGYGDWQNVRMTTPAVAAVLQQYAVPGAREAHVGEMLAVSGFATLRLAENFCPGFPLHEMVNGKLSYGLSVTTADAFEHALVRFDSALSWAADSVRVLNFARLGRARALLNLGRFAEAATAVAGVPTGYTYQAEFSVQGPVNDLSFGAPGPPWGSQRSVADREGGTGMNFISANDPRVQTTRRGTARDGTTGLYSINKYDNRGAPLQLASGVEARLIEAEAALRANPGNPQWLAILNALRSTVSGLAPLADPGSETARVDLLFRERAFWLFATGSRLVDLRRLVRNYGRAAETVFPTGTYWLGDTYRAGTSLPFPVAEIEASPGVTGCTAEQ